MAEPTPTETLTAPPIIEAVRWQLIMRPLGAVALRREELPKDDPRLRALDLLSQGREVLAAHLGIAVEELTSSHVDEELGDILQHYGARTIPQAFCKAVDARDILVPVSEPTDAGKYDPQTKGILRNTASGFTPVENRNALGLTVELFGAACRRTQAQLGAQPSFISFMRREYELGIRTVPQKQPETRTPAYVFSLPNHEPIELSPAMVWIIDDRSNGLSNKEIGLKHRVSEATVKKLLKEIFRRLDAVNAAEMLTKAVVLGHIAIGTRPVTENVPSKREVMVIALAAQGLSNEDIAARLSITVNTAKKHMRKSMPKVGARSRMQAVRKLIELDILRVDNLAAQQ